MRYSSANSSTFCLLRLSSYQLKNLSMSVLSVFVESVSVFLIDAGPKQPASKTTPMQTATIATRFIPYASHRLQLDTWKPLPMGLGSHLRERRFYPYAASTGRASHWDGRAGRWIRAKDAGLNDKMGSDGDLLGGEAAAAVDAL